jgi:hypothetical protein
MAQTVTLIPVDDTQAPASPLSVTLVPVEEIPKLSKAPEDTIWGKATTLVKDIINPRAPGSMSPADIADAQIRMEAHDQGLKKEAYLREVNPDGAFERRGSRTAKGVVAGAVSTVEGMAGSLEWLSNGKIGRELANEAKLWGQDLLPEEHDFGDSLASGVGSMATFFIPGMGVVKGANAVAKVSPRLASWLGSGTATAMEAMTEAGTVYRNVLSETHDIAGAEKAATKTFWLNVPLLLVTNKLGIFGEKGGQLRRTGTSAGMEGIQEGGQEVISTTSSDKPIDWANVGESAAVGALTGGMFSLKMPQAPMGVTPQQRPGPSPADPGAPSVPPAGTPPPLTSPVVDPAATIPESPTVKEAATAQGILEEGEAAKQEYIKKQKAEAAAKKAAEAAEKTPPVTVELTPVVEEKPPEVVKETPAPLPAAPVTKTADMQTGVETPPAEIVQPGATSQAAQEIKASPEIAAAANEAATSPENNLPEPTPAQQKAGNYKKGHVNYQGLDISIENPAGSVRKGVDEHGNEWETELASHYGYIKRTTGKDGDHIDVFIPPDVDPASDKVFVVDQKDTVTGAFDEHKVMLGFASKEEAKQGYLDNYDESGKDRIMNITEMSVDDFKGWLKDGDQKKPAAWQQKKAPAVTPAPAPVVEPAGTAKPAAALPAAQPEATPEARIAAFVKQRLDEGESLTKKELWDISDEAYGGRKSEGKYNPKDAYDAMEMGINQHIAGIKEVDIQASAQDAQETVSALKLLVDRVPTQTTRTEEMDEFQQFSTPPPLAYVVNWAANIKGKDNVLEPSAGVGGIASFAKRVAKTFTNELSSRRAGLLKQMGFDGVFTENAEQIHNILPKDVKPTVIVMNPPFSSTAGRKQGERKTINATLHIDQALARLEEGGRLVAIVGEGMAEGKPTFIKWWTELKKQYNVRANIGINGQEYKKYGTTFGNQIVVIDKTGPTGDRVVTGQVEKIEDLIPLLKEIRDDRGNAATKQEADKPSGKDSDAKPKVPVKPDAPVRAATGDSNSGGRPDVGGQPAAGTSAPVVKGETKATDGQNDGSTSGSGQPGSNITGADRPAGVRSGDNSSVPRNTDGQAAGVSVQPDEKVTEGVKVESKAAEVKTAEETPGAIYNEYDVQRINIPGAKKHPGALVESAAMAAVQSPAVSYSPSIPQEAIEAGRVSMAQLEAVVYAGAAHEELLPSGERKGYFIGDGTGVGKGREIAAIIWDNWNKGRKKSVWISKNSPLRKDAGRDVDGVGWAKERLFSIQATKLASKVENKEGICFVGYGTLRTDKTAKGGGKRVDQLVEWLGEDFDGVIVYDESHNMGNAIDIKEGRHTKKASAQARAGLELQQRLPKARVVYVSATGATEVKNLSYAQRLGLWGKNTAFATVRDFVNEISAGGLAVMEVIARDLKAMGLYCARSLSYEGVGYERIEHALSSDQQAAYDEMADAWQVVLRSVDGVMQTTGAAENAEARKDVKGAFWTANQRFWNQIVTSMQMPSVIKSIEKDIAAGHAPVLQFVNTNEAALTRAVENMEEEDTVEDLDLSPKDILINFLEAHYPTQQYQEVTDDNGNTTWVPVVDSQGVRVENAAAVAARDALIERIGGLKRVPDGPLDQILNHFGTDVVAEVTGRSRRVVEQDTPEGRRRVLQKWSQPKSTSDADAFQGGKKKILMFSDAGGTGRSYHADKDAINQTLRRHYVIQPGWRADNAVQGLGRTHRTNEKQAPEYILVTTDLPGHKRFISSIARRLDQLGALTKGQRSAGSQGLFEARDNLESDFATQALEETISSIARGHIESIPANEFVRQSGLAIIDENGQVDADKFPDIPQFLNRLLNMKRKMQNDVFEIFSAALDARIAKALEEGRGLGGLETIQAKRVETLSEQVVYTDPKTGAETKYLSLDLVRNAKLLTFQLSDQYARGGYFRNIKSGHIWTIGNQRTVQDQNGRIRTIVPAVGPGYGAHNIDLNDIHDKEKYEPLSHKEAEALWDKEFAERPQEIKETIHLITGLTLPIWDRLPQGEARIFRVMTKEGPVIGRKINAADLKRTLAALGASSSGASVKASPSELYDNILYNNAVVSLSNGWKLVRRKVQGESRIEVLGIDYNAAQLYRDDGLIFERINYNIRFFIPTERAAGEKLIAAITSAKPVVAIDSGGGIGNQSGFIDLHILGVPQMATAIRKLMAGINPKAAKNITVKQNKSDLGFLRAILASPGAITGKARYYVVHGKNAHIKQERLRGIIKEKMDVIFGKLDKADMGALESLEWMGDAEGVNYNIDDLVEMGVTVKVQNAYLAHRKFHNQAWRMLKAHRKAYGADVEGMKGIEGHVPHLFENWSVYEMVERETEGKDGSPVTVKEPGGIVGTFRSLREATGFANSLDPQKDYSIRPKAFRMPDDMIARTVLKDSSYFKMVENVEKDFQVTKDEAHEMVKEIARRKNRRRFLGTLMKRKGQSGYRLDNIREIFTEYYNGVARYIALDDFKARVVPKYERDFGVELGRGNQAIRDKNVARYVEDYVNDLNGVPGMIEDYLNASIMASPFFAQYVRTQRPAVWMVNKAMHVTAILKLGLFNLSAGVVNLIQLTNTFSKVPAKHFATAFGKVIGMRLNASDRALIRRLGVEHDLGLTDTGGYSAISKGGNIVNASLFFFRGAEYLNRAITGIAAYETAREKGAGYKDARQYAREIIDATQFDYSVADTSMIFRNPAGRLIGQFKPYAVKQVEFVMGLKGAENIKFWIPALLMAGTAGIPLIEGLSDLIKWITGVDPLLEVKQFLMKWAGDDAQKKAVARVALYGVGSVVGIDVSRRVGTGDVLPKRAADLLGPTISTLLNAKKIMETGDKTEFVRSLSPSVGNLLTAVETVMNGMEVTDPYHRDRAKYEATGGDVAAKAAGFRPVRESELSDVQNIAVYERDKYTKLQQKYVDQAIGSLHSGDADGFVTAITKAAEKGVVIDSKAIEYEIVQKVLPPEIRMLLKARMIQRGNQLQLNEYLNAGDETDQ